MTFVGATRLREYDVDPFYNELAKEVYNDGVALRRGILDQETSHQLELWWKDIKPKLESGAIGRSSVHVNLQSTVSGNTHLEDTFFNNLHKHPVLLAIAQACLGQNLCHLMSRLLVKDRSVVGPVECHQDWPYFIGDTKKLAIMVPVTSHTEQNGKLYYLLGSHHFGPLPRGDIDYAKYSELKSSGPDLNIGDVLVHDFLTWHYSGPSKDQQDRAVIQVVYQPSTDASSKTLVSGQICNRYSCENPATPMARIDSSYSLDQVQSLRNSAVKEARETAFKICAGFIKEKNSSALSAHAFLAQMAIEEGHLEKARNHVKRLITEYVAFQATINELEREIAANETEIADIALSRIAPINQGSVTIGADAVALVTDPRQWAFSAESAFDIPGIESETRIIRISLKVESGALGVGWLQENGSAWVARGSATASSTATELDLIIPAHTGGGKLIFDNWTEAGEPARGIIRGLKIIAAKASPRRGKFVNQANQ
jgi:hypothetical protein